MSYRMLMSAPLNIHPTAIVHERAKIAPGCHIGPYCIIGPNVVLHGGVRLDSHVVIERNTNVGENSHICSFSVLGGDPQHVAYSGQETHLIIGKNAQIREHVTIHRGTMEGGGSTTVGDRVFLMVGVHIAHDCRVGDDVVMANQATLGGHVDIGSHAVLGGLCAIHQFTRIGEGAMIAGFSGVNTDVIPYGMVLGYRAKLKGINRVKLRRLHATHEEIRAIYAAFQWIFQRTGGSFSQRIDTLPQEILAFPRAQRLQEFLKYDFRRSICMMEAVSDLESPL